MVANRDPSLPGVTHKPHSLSDEQEKLGMEYAMGSTPMSTTIPRTSADAVFKAYETIFSILSPEDREALYTGSCVKVSPKTTMRRQTSLAVRLLYTPDRRCGLRVFSYDNTFGYRFGYKPGFKQVPPDRFTEKDNQLTKEFLAVSNRLGMPSCCLEGRESCVVHAVGQRVDDTHCCDAAVELWFSKTDKPVFRQSDTDRCDLVASPHSPMTARGDEDVV